MITIRAYAKLNLYLQITGSRVDGYHDLDMIMQSIDLHDTLRLSRAGDIQLTCSHPEVPLGESNIAHKAARRFFRETGIAGGVHADIQKRIPMAAGLGGGSADGAAMLRGLNCLYGYPLSERRLLALAAGIGADVPFSLTGGCRRAQGIGERLTALRNQLPGVYLLLKPEGGVSTKDAYQTYDARLAPEPYGMEECMHALETGDLAAFSRHTFNSLQHPAASLCPEIAALLRFLQNTAPASFLTGSGSTCVGLFSSQEEAEAARRCAPACAFSYIAKNEDCGLRLS